MSAPSSSASPSLSARMDSPIGSVWVRCRGTDGAVEEVVLGEDRPEWAVQTIDEAESATAQDGRRNDHDPALARLGDACRQLGEYFAGRRREFDLPLALEGTAFQRVVWDQLMKIPFGETISYRELARRSGNPGAARAVGGANGRNPVPIIVPCHRVIAANGALGGYSSGLERKRVLLDLERTSAERSKR